MLRGRFGSHVLSLTEGTDIVTDEIWLQSLRITK